MKLHLNILIILLSAAAVAASLLQIERQCMEKKLR